jgi:hypothetical protein
MLSLLGTKVDSCKRGLHCVDAGHILEIVVKCDTSCCIFGLVQIEARIVKVEVWIQF